MYRSISLIRPRTSGKLPGLGGWCYAAAMVACLGLAGCANLGSCGGSGPSGFDTVDYDREIPMPDAQGDFFGVSNTARQIEKSLSR